MTLNINGFIEEGDILQITALKRGKVHRVWGFQDDSLVLKWEPGLQSNRIDEGTELIGGIDSVAKPVPLTGSELYELLSWCGNKIEWIKRQRKLMNDPSHDKELYQAADDIELNIKDKIPGYKLPMLKVRTLEDALNDYGSKDKKPLKSFVKDLLANDGLEQLGRIVALDLILANTDRFYPENKSAKTVNLGGKEIALETIVNLGNIMLATQGTLWRVSALDSFDPGSHWKYAGDNSYTTRETNKGSDIITWPVRYLVGPALRRRYAEQILSDLEKLFLPVRRSLFAVFGRKEIDRLVWGMIEGGQTVNDQLKKYIKGHVKQGGKLVERWSTMIPELNKLHH